MDYGKIPENPVMGIPELTRETLDKSTIRRSYLASQTERFRAVNCGNMLMAITAGLNAINWPAQGFGSRTFILTILALCNGRDRVTARAERVAEMLGKSHLPLRSQKSLITRHHRGLEALAKKLNREPINVDPGRRVGEATVYDCRALILFALAVMAKYDVLRVQSRQLRERKLNAPQNPVRSLTRAESAPFSLVAKNASASTFSSTSRQNKKFNPTEAILSAIPSCLSYIPLPGNSEAPAAEPPTWPA